MFENAQGLRDEFAALESALADPETHADLGRARRVGRRYAELAPIVKGMDEYERVAADLEAARELSEADPGFAIEAAELSARLDVGHRAADPAARAARPQRLRGCPRRDQVRRGWRGVGLVRR